MKSTLVIILVGIFFAIFLVGGFQFSRKSASPLIAYRLADKQNEYTKQQGLQLRELKYVPVCKPDDKMALWWVIDVSSSMASKLQGVKDGIKVLAQSLNQNDMLGVLSFFANTNIEVDFKKYKGNELYFNPRIDRIGALGDGRNMQDAFALHLKKQIDIARPTLKDYRWAVILVTNGKPVPESKDPTSFINNTLKPSRITVITIALEADQESNAFIRKLATSGQHFLISQNRDELKALLCR